MAMASQYMRTATLTKNMAEAHIKSRKLYRHALKLIPWMQDTYTLEYTKKQMRDTIRSHFDKHGHIKEKDTIDVLVFQGENEVQEALNIWKTRSHVVKFFEPIAVDKRTLYDRMLEGEPVHGDRFVFDESDPNWVYPQNQNAQPEKKGSPYFTQW